jgi:lysophospholipase L1-like esterase
MLDTLVFWGLIPIAGLQGLALRKQALRLPPPPGNVQGVFGQNSHNRFTTPLRLLALGDSIIAGIGANSQQGTLTAQLARALAEQAQRPVSWKARGRNGATSFELPDMLEASRNEPAPHLVLVSMGVNDVTGLSSKRAWRANLETFFTKLGALWPETRLVFVGLPPMQEFPLPPQPLRHCLGLRAAELDRIAAELIDKHAGMLHIPTTIDHAEHDFCADGFHPSESAYAVWGDELAQLISARYPDIAGRPAA